MHLILLSGGSGKRLWPLSNDIRAKQFLKLLENPFGNKESMVQRVWRQLNDDRIKDLWKSITIAASESQQEQLKIQLNQKFDIVTEPERRDTFPAIALACSFLYSEKDVNLEDNVIILPIDPYVEIDYFYKLLTIKQELEKTHADLILLGTRPLFPSEKYGYIVPEDSLKSESLFRITKFVEKPKKEVAELLIKQNALWNCGVFGMQLKYILNMLKEKYQFHDINYHYVKEHFCNLPQNSFDYEVVEQAHNIRALEYVGPWKDLGTWETITEEIKKPIAGNALLSKSCKNTHIINELETPIIAMGIENAIIAASYDGILVANKGETYQLKELISDVDNRPMYEECWWGKYIILDYCKTENNETLTKKLIISSGKQTSYQYHRYRKEIWTIVSGEGILYLNGKKKKVYSGDTIIIGYGEKYGIYACSPLEIIEVQWGTPLLEEDTIRLELEWDPNLN